MNIWRAHVGLIFGVFFTPCCLNRADCAVCVYVYLTVRVGSREKKKSYGCVELCVYATNKIDYINKTQLSLKTYSTTHNFSSTMNFICQNMKRWFRISTSFDSFLCFSIQITLFCCFCAIEKPHATCSIVTFNDMLRICKFNTIFFEK